MTNPILIIDDDAGVRAVLKRILESEGYEVALADNGRHGLEMMQTLSPSLVITDIIMPEKDGLETIIELRKIASGLKIIAISGGGRMGNTDFLKIAGRLGADAVLPKPFMPDEVLDAVRKHLPAD